MKANLIFIPDIFPSKRWAYEAEDRLSNYLNQEYNQFKTTRCNDKGKVVRLFSNYLTSVKEHPDELLSQLEKYSPIFVSNARSPMIFKETIFANNTGIFGGAICVDNPDFRYENKDEQLFYTLQTFRPYVVLWGSTFEQN